MTVREREQEIESAATGIEQLDRAADALRAGNTAELHRAFDQIRKLWLRLVPPVPVSVAAKMLSVSEPTVRDWADRGLLQEVKRERGPRAFTLKSVLVVHRELDELRKLGRSRRLREDLEARIDDRITADSRAVRRGLQQARAPKRRHYVHRREAGSRGNR
jgi:DNA-binding transcriptional MerR regulator